MTSSLFLIERDIPNNLIVKGLFETAAFQTNLIEYALSNQIRFAKQALDLTSHYKYFAFDLLRFNLFDSNTFI